MSSAMVSVSAPTNSVFDPKSSDFLSTSPSRSSIKRRAAPATPSDCLSLQSSLKRVRLSCSPGELRLQRDLRELSSSGWQPLDDVQQGGSNPSVSYDSSPRWYLAGGAVPAELHVLDPLRLVLNLQLPTRAVGRIWIQVPRMYPHRPPSITRLENMWMDHILVQEAPPSGTSGQGSSEEADRAISSAVLVYKEWSPIKNLGELLDFLVESCSYARSTSSDATSSVSSRVASPVTAVPSNANRSAYSVQGTQSHALGHQHFVEEHKMEDVHMSHHSVASLLGNTKMTNTSQSKLFAPNRFDVGYGKYEDPLSSQSSSLELSDQTSSMFTDAPPQDSGHDPHDHEFAMEMS